MVMVVEKVFMGGSGVNGARRCGTVGTLEGREHRRNVGGNCGFGLVTVVKVVVVV